MTANPRLHCIVKRIVGETIKVQGGLGPGLFASWIPSCWGHLAAVGGGLRSTTQNTTLHPDERGLALSAVRLTSIQHHSGRMSTCVLSFTLGDWYGGSTAQVSLHELLSGRHRIGLVIGVRAVAPFYKSFLMVSLEHCAETPLALHISRNLLLATTPYWMKVNELLHVDEDNQICNGDITVIAAIRALIPLPLSQTSHYS